MRERRRPSSGQVDVVATTTQIGDFARAVGGDAVDVHQILQPNTDPHEYEPRPDDVIATADAAVVLENGDELDRWMSDVIDDAGGSPRVVDLVERPPGEGRRRERAAPRRRATTRTGGTTPQRGGGGPTRSAMR